MQNNKKTVRAILQALNIVSLEQKYEYKVCYEYKFSTSLNDIVVVRKLIIFLGRSPVWSQYFNNDLEIITFLLQEMEKFENGTIHYDTKPQREKKKRGRKPKNKELNQEVLTNEKD